ncbi:MAG: hypothetical protein LBQ24_02760 [Candidatus Peribacteria bacterium]|nr:hypothetical protein [Candidatus Peribacteria bacterium]
MFQIVLNAIFIAFKDFCHFFSEYWVYCIFTGTSLNLIFFTEIISIISEAWLIPSCVILILFKIFFLITLYQLCVSVSFIPLTIYVKNIHNFKTVFLNKGILLFLFKNLLPKNISTSLFLFAIS